MPVPAQAVSVEGKMAGGEDLSEPAGKHDYLDITTSADLAERYRVFRCATCGALKVVRCEEAKA